MYAFEKASVVGRPRTSEICWGNATVPESTFLCPTLKNFGHFTMGNFPLKDEICLQIDLKVLLHEKLLFWTHLCASSKKPLYFFFKPGKFGKRNYCANYIKFPKKYINKLLQVWAVSLGQHIILQNHGWSSEIYCKIF